MQYKVQWSVLYMKIVRYSALTISPFDDWMRMIVQTTHCMKQLIWIMLFFRWLLCCCVEHCLIHLWIIWKINISLLGIHNIDFIKNKYWAIHKSAPVIKVSSIKFVAYEHMQCNESTLFLNTKQAKCIIKLNLGIIIHNS